MGSEMCIRDRFTTVLAISCILAACSSLQLTRDNIKKTGSEPASIEPTAAPMSPLEYSWDTDYSAMLTPPLEVRGKALAACRQRGFDRAYMETISLNENMAKAYFSCRGSDN